MSAKKSCQRCGSDELVQGRLQSSGRVSFRPQHVRFATLHVADLPVVTFMCAACGEISLQGDVEKLRQLRPVQKSVTGIASDAAC